MSGGKVQEYSTGPHCAICQIGRSPCIELGSFVYILGPLSSGKVPDDSTGFLCISWV